MLQKIVTFHQDEAHDWVADLACGHSRHVRHQPPFINRPWTTTPEGRAGFIGVELECARCDEGIAEEKTADEETPFAPSSPELN